MSYIWVFMYTHRGLWLVATASINLNLVALSRRGLTCHVDPDALKTALLGAPLFHAMKCLDSFLLSPRLWRGFIALLFFFDFGIFSSNFTLHKSLPHILACFVPNFSHAHIWFFLALSPFPSLRWLLFASFGRRCLVFFFVSTFTSLSLTSH